MRLSALLPLVFLLVNVSASGEGGRYSLSDDSSGRTHSSDADKHYHRFTERVPDRYSSSHRSHHSYSGVTGVYTGYTSKDDNFGSTIGREKGEEVSSKPPPKRRSLYEPYAPAPSLVRRSPSPSGETPEDHKFKLQSRPDGVYDTRSGNDGKHENVSGGTFYFSGLESGATKTDPPSGRRTSTSKNSSSLSESPTETPGTWSDSGSTSTAGPRQYGHTLGKDRGEEVSSRHRPYQQGKSSGQRSTGHLYRRSGSAGDSETDMASGLTNAPPPPPRQPVQNQYAAHRARHANPPPARVYGHTVGADRGEEVTSPFRPPLPLRPVPLRPEAPQQGQRRGGHLQRRSSGSSERTATDMNSGLSNGPPPPPRHRAPSAPESPRDQRRTTDNKGRAHGHTVGADKGEEVTSRYRQDKEDSK